MKKQLVFMVVLGVIFSMNGYAQGTLEVIVKNIRASKGTIRVGLFNREGDFLKSAVEGKVVRASGTEVKVIFSGLKPGDYAISVIHDENENEKLDKNFMGIPTEGFGFGNNAMGTFGPPDFEDARVKVGDGVLKEEIGLRYM